MATFVKITLSSGKVPPEDDLQSVLELARAVGIACRDEQTHTQCNEETLQKLTGQSNEVCSLLIGCSTPPTLHAWSEQRAITQERSPLYNLIRTHHPITHDAIRDLLNEEIDLEVDPKALDPLLASDGLRWTKVKDKVLLLERPETVLPRQRYLRSIIKHRENNKSIVYIAQHENDKDIFFAAVFPPQGIIDMAFIEKDKVKLEQRIKDITESLGSDVVVIRRGIESKPNEFTSKAELCSLLNKQDIPHSSEMHRSELLKLAKRCSNFPSNTVLLPPTENHLYLFRDIIPSNIEINDEEKSELLEMMQAKTSQEWTEREREVMVEELKSWREEKEIEIHTEKVLSDLSVCDPYCAQYSLDTVILP